MCSRRSNGAHRLHQGQGQGGDGAGDGGDGGGLGGLDSLGILVDRGGGRGRRRRPGGGRALGARVAEEEGQEVVLAPGRLNIGVLRWKAG